MDLHLVVNYHSWDLKVLGDLKAMVPKFQFIMPIIGKQTGIVSRIEGGLEGVPEMIKIAVKEKNTSVYFFPGATG